MPAPKNNTNKQKTNELTRPGEAASSHVRCGAFGISWLALTSASSASPPKLVSKPQISCCGSINETSWPAASSSSTDRQWATTSSPAFHFVTPNPTRSTTPARSEPTTWYGWSCFFVSEEYLPYRSRKPNVDTGSKIDVHTVL